MVKKVKIEIVVFKEIVFYFMKNAEPERRLYFIIYKGDNKVAKKAPLATTTHKKVMDEIVAKIEKVPQRIYADVLASSTKDLSRMTAKAKKSYEQIYAPKNPKQVYNKIFYERAKESMGRDGVFNVCEISRSLKGFVQQYMILPEETLICSELYSA